MTETLSVAQRLESIERRIEAACARCGRERSQVTLVGASKMQPLDTLRQAFDAGLRVFGENRVQEAEAKAPELPAEIEWHLIGPLQSNKARRASELFSVVHSVDRLKIARRLDRERAGTSPLACFLEVNLGEEASKHGFLPGELADAARALASLENLRIVGLMAIPPQASARAVDAEAETRRWFRRLARLRDEWLSQPGFEDCPGWLSMGMSADFEVAIEEGATHVRVGTALFGPRPKPDEGAG